MAATHGTLDGPTVEEQVIAAEASSSVLQGDLKQMREDRREFIKANRRALAKMPKFSETFGQVQSTDMPPQFRAILEDNRVLHEQIRHYKKQLHEAQTSNTVHEKHINRLQLEIKRLHDTFQVSAERDSASTIRQQEGDLQKLRDQVSVLAHAKETDGRRFRHIATERHRERQDLRAEMDRLKAQLIEKDKAFRAQAFTLKQANTRVQQMQQQQQQEAEQAQLREAALVEEEMACCQDPDADVCAEAGISGVEVGFVFGQGGTLRGTLRAGSTRSGSVSPIKRKQSVLAKTLSSTGGTLRLNSITSMLSSREDDYTEPPVESFKMMLIMLRPDAVEGFHHQARMQAVMRRRLNRDPEEAAIVIQSAWRMKQAQAEVSRLKQQQEAQLQAAAEQQASMERQASQSPRLRQANSMGKATVRRSTIITAPTKPAKGSGSQADSPKSPRRKVTRTSDRGSVGASTVSRSPVNGSSDAATRGRDSPQTGAAGKGPSRQPSSIRS